MNIKKLAVGVLAAVTAGATLGLGTAHAADLSSYVVTSNGALSSPIIVVGDSVPGSDVIGAADLAAHIAGYATKDVVISGSAASVSVSGGASLDTPNQKLYMNDSIARATQTLTSSHLPVLLASGTVATNDGDFDFDQFIEIGARRIQFGKSSEDIDPVPHIQLGTTATSQAYTLKVVFNKALTMNDTDTAGEEFKIFGSAYTISSDSAYGEASGDDIVLFGSGTTITLSEGEETQATVGGNTYTIKLVGVSSPNIGDTAIVTVDDGSSSKTDDVVEGNSRKINALNIFAKDVFFLSKENQVSSATLQLGAQKLLFNDGSEVKEDVDGNENNIDNTLVTITGTPGASEVSSIEIQIAAEESDDDHVAVDTPFMDTVFKNFEIAFGGFSPASDSAAYEEIKFDTAGDDDGTIRFTDSRGNTKSVNAIDQPGITEASMILGDTGGDQIHVYEGANVTEDEYMMVDSGDFGHLFEVTEIDPATGSDEGEVTFRDVVSGSSISKTLPQGNNDVTWIIDGQTYYLSVNDLLVDTLVLTWGTNAANNDVGDSVTVFPLLKSSKEARIAFTDVINISNLNLTGLGLLTGDTIEFPGDPRVTYTIADTVNTNLLLTSASMSSSVPQISYNISINVNDTTGNFGIVIGIADVDAANQRLINPAVIILEEEDDDNEQHAVILDIAWDSANNEVQWNEPTFTNANGFGGVSLETDSKVNAGRDEWGTTYTYDTDPDQPNGMVMYPDYQAFAQIAIGANPVFSVGGVTGTVKQAVLITSPVAKFAKEVSTASLTSDLILVGGPCANALVADLAAVNGSVIPSCSSWTLTTGLIKEVADAFGSGQKALVVAGTVAADTRSLAAQVMSGTTDFLT